MKNTLKIIGIAALSLTLAGCGAKRTALTSLYFGDPTPEQCAVVADIGKDVIGAGEKADTAQRAAIVASPLFAPIATVAGVIDVVLAGGEDIYDSAAAKYAEKCAQAQ